MGRPKKNVMEVVAKPEVETIVNPSAAEAKKQVNKLYEQLEKLMVKNKIKKTALAQVTEMSYQGFLNSLKSQNIKLEHWYVIGDLVGKPFVARFESSKKAANIGFDIEDSNTEMNDVLAASPAPAPVNHNLEIKEAIFNNAQEKIALLEKQVSILEDRLKDKNMIISMLQSK